MFSHPGKVIDHRFRSKLHSKWTFLPRRLVGYSRAKRWRRLAYCRAVRASLWSSSSSSSYALVVVTSSSTTAINIISSLGCMVFVGRSCLAKMWIGKVRYLALWKLWSFSSVFIPLMWGEEKGGEGIDSRSLEITDVCRRLLSDFARSESLMCVEDCLRISLAWSQWCVSTILFGKGTIRDASRRLKRHLAHVETRVELVEA